MSKFIKVTTYNGKVVWLNSANIVAITQSESKSDAMVVLTNAADGNDGQYYLVKGSPEELVEALCEDVVAFS